MKKIINGLMYDTSTATEIYFDKKKDRKYYKTENGNYFCMYSNSEIKPMSEDSVKEFLGEVNVDAYINVFGKPKMA